MPIRDAQRRRKAKGGSAPSRHFAPAAFLKGTPEQVRSLCDELATVAAERFSDLTGTTWRDAGLSLVRQLRELGHDLSSFDETEELQEWQATWHHPRGTCSLLLSFRAPHAVEVTWKVDDEAYTTRR
jgi:hypothetical protein